MAGLKLGLQALAFLNKEPIYYSGVFKHSGMRMQIPGHWPLDE
jgi:hypothetical protein